MKRLRIKIALWLAPELSDCMAEADAAVTRANILIKEWAFRFSAVIAGEDPFPAGGYRRVDVAALLKWAKSDSANESGKNIK